MPSSPRELSREELIALVERQAARIAELERLLAEVLRRGKRQAAPFSRGKAKSEPKRPGRKAGALYGRQAVRERPRDVDRTLVAPCPLWCPSCEAPVELEGRGEQYQTDIRPVRARTIRFEVHWGRCTGCGRRVQGRHPRQTSDALGVCGMQVGPVAMGTAAHLNKLLGLSYAKTSWVLGRLFGLRVSRSTLARALMRAGRRAEATNAVLKSQIRASPVVYPDETGWRIGGRNAWLHVATDGSRTTVYEIEKGRGYEEAASLLGEGYGGVIGSDGWAPYRRFQNATRQACLSHLLRRCGEMQETATGAAVRFPRAVKQVLKRAFEIRDERDDGRLSREQVERARRELERQIGRLLEGTFRHPANRRLAKHLRALQNDLFRFVSDPRLEGTNWPAETELRYAVINRKTCGGGNRSWNGAKAQAVLMTVARTAIKRGYDDVAAFADILHAPTPFVHPLAFNAGSLPVAVNRYVGPSPPDRGPSRRR